ncbi:MAG: hypothetical protein M3281_01865, partial [Chloroflexota bacterium]|nr:hypothetical protein [Chloroflexota bacterium]
PERQCLPGTGGTDVNITPTSVIAEDQDKAPRLCTEILGLVKHTDLPAGARRWLTVVWPEGLECVEFLLGPTSLLHSRLLPGGV